MSTYSTPPCIETGIGYKDATLNGSTTIAKTGELEINGSCVINGDVCLEDGGDLDIVNGASLTINGNLCIELGSTVTFEGSAWDYQNIDLEAGGALEVTGTVTIAADCHCSGCD